MQASADDQIAAVPNIFFFEIGIFHFELEHL